MKIGLQKEWNNNAKEEVKLERKMLPKKEVAFKLVFQASLEKNTVVYMTFRYILLCIKIALKHVFLSKK
jgi:hypothetical protein